MKLEGVELSVKEERNFWLWSTGIFRPHRVYIQIEVEVWRPMVGPLNFNFRTNFMPYILRVSFQTGLRDSLMVLVFLLTLSPLQRRSFTSLIQKDRWHWYPMLFQRRNKIKMWTLIQKSNRECVIKYVPISNHYQLCCCLCHHTYHLFHSDCSTNNDYWSLISPVRNQLDFDIRVAQAIRVHWD